LEDLLVRVNCLVRRKYGCPSPIVRFGGLELNTNNRTVQRDGSIVELTPREYRLLEYLAMNQGKVISRSEIEEHIYNDNVELFSNVVESAISTLRNKLLSLGVAPLIQTRRGLGYVLHLSLRAQSA